MDPNPKQLVPLYKKNKFGHRLVQRKNSVKKQKWRRNHLQVKEKSLRRNQPYRKLDLGLVASSSVRK